MNEASRFCRMRDVLLVEAEILAKIQGKSRTRWNTKKFGGTWERRRCHHDFMARGGSLVHLVCLVRLVGLVSSTKYTGSTGQTRYQ